MVAGKGVLCEHTHSANAGGTGPAQLRRDKIHSYIKAVEHFQQHIRGIGYQLGYGGIANSVAIAVDTYQIPGILVLVNSDIDAPIAYDSSVSFTPGNYFAWVSYSPTSEVLSVYLNSADAKPPTPTLTASVNLYSILVPTLSTTPQMFVGFTGGTGEYYADQDVLNWSFDDSDVAPEPGTVGLVLVGLAGFTFRIRRCAGKKRRREITGGQVQRPSSTTLFTGQEEPQGALGR